MKSWSYGRLLLALLFFMQAWFPATLAEEAKQGGYVPRLSDFRILGIPDEIRPLGESIPAAYTKGTELVIWEDRIALYDFTDVMPLLHLYDIQPDGNLLLKAEYQEEARIASIVLWEDGIAYLVGENGFDRQCELVFIDAKGVRTRVSLGPIKRAHAPDIGPLLRLSDGRLLFADGEGHLQMCEADGSDMRQVSAIPMQSFVYYDEYVYFTNLQDMVTYERMYCSEYDEYLDEAYPRLYRMRLDGTDVERLTDCGARGLVSQGPFIFYQNIDDPFVWPQGEMPEEWLYGVVYCYDVNTDWHYTLGLDSAAYMPTPYGLAAWMPDKPDGEIRWLEDFENFDGACPDFSLILYDWHGDPLNRLDAAFLYWYELPWFVTDETICMYQYNGLDNTFVFYSVPLDGNQMSNGDAD